MTDSDATQRFLERLEGVPARIARAVEGWDADRLHTPPAPGEWSACDILAHLRAADDIVTPRAYMLLTRDTPPLIAFDERRWAEVAGYADADFHASLQVYILRRVELARALRKATDADWRRDGALEAYGPISLQALLNGFVAHEEEHCAQIERL